MYRVEITGKTEDVFEVRSGKDSMMSAPETISMSPGESLLMSLGNCMGIFIRRYLDHAGFASSEFSLKLEAEFCREAPVRFKKIKVSADLKSAGLDPERKEALRKFVENCPIGNTLKGNPDIELELR